MAGYLMALSEESFVRQTVERGVYSTVMGLAWSGPTTSTLGDYVTMRPGDHIYFFSKRNVYGIGEICEAAPGSAFAENHDGATDGSTFRYPCGPSVTPEDTDALAAAGKVRRWFVTFRPSPAFFSEPVDMDELLESDPAAFRSIRVFWKRSFVKLDDREDMAFVAALVRKNKGELEDALSSAPRTAPSFPGAVRPDLRALARAKREKRGGALSSEMVLEVCLLDALTRRDPGACRVFGSWDYLSHQVPASPMKQADYMDRIDVFGYRWVRGYEGKVVEQYLVCELKKDASGGDDLPQLMKYVDYVVREYANGDYSMVRAFLVASGFGPDGLPGTRRDYVVGKPARARSWSDVTAVEYLVDGDGNVSFEEVGRPDAPF